jgi:hypothetical protein
MVQPFSKSSKTLLLRFSVAGGVAVLALLWGVSNWSPQLASQQGGAAAMDSSQANVAANSTAQVKDSAQSMASAGAEQLIAESSSGSGTGTQPGEQSPAGQAPNPIGIGSAPQPAMLSNGNSFEDQLQAQSSAELRERFPVEDSPSGVSTQPPATPGMVNPHQ